MNPHRMTSSIPETPAALRSDAAIGRGGVGAAPTRNPAAPGTFGHAPPGSGDPAAPVCTPASGISPTLGGTGLGRTGSAAGTPAVGVASVSEGAGAALPGP